MAKPLDKRSYPTQIKICGFTRANEAVAACDFGADSIGLVFYPPSSRNVSVQQACEIVSSLPPFVVVTGLFLNADPAFVEEVLSDVPLSMLQFHGTEDAKYCRSFQRPYMKSVAMKSVANDCTESVENYCNGFPDARGFLLDSNAAGAAGGSGETFDWKKVPQSLAAPVILAGGLDAGNVTDAVRIARPAAVDVSSGVESSKGVKDTAKMREFIQCVRDADAHS